jgi:RecA/RadA recombinase
MARPKKQPKKEEVAEGKKDKKAPVPSVQERRDALIANFNKRMNGRAVIMPASQYSLPFLYRRYPTGLLTLDTALRGGCPGGGITQICGVKNVGKTWLMWQILLQQQHYLGDKLRVLMAMTELRADRSQAKACGVKISLGEDNVQELIRAREIARLSDPTLPPYSKEELADMREEVGVIDEMHGMAAEDLYDGILDAVEANAYHLVVIDSFGSIMSMAESEADSVRDRQVAGVAGPNTKFLRKLNALMTMNDKYGKPRDLAVIGINQIRANIGGDSHRPFKTTGGFLLEHSKLVDIWLTPGPQEKEKRVRMTSKGMTEQEEVVRKHVYWRIEKGKAGLREGESGAFVYSFDVNTADFYLDHIVAGVNHGIVEKAGNWLRIPNPENPDKALFGPYQGVRAFSEAMAADLQAAVEKGDRNLSMMDYIRRKVYAANKIEIRYDGWE